jgi:hypothetical protein
VLHQDAAMHRYAAYVDDEKGRGTEKLRVEYSIGKTPGQQKAGVAVNLRPGPIRALSRSAPGLQ